MSNTTPSDATLAQIQSASTAESSENSCNEPPPPPPIHPNTMRENGTPSPLTMPSLPSNAQNRDNTSEEMVSIRCITFIENENGYHLSIPQQPTEVSLSPYTNPYDSDGEEGPFFDAVLNELNYCSRDEDEDELLQSSPVIQPIADPAAQPAQAQHHNLSQTQCCKL